MVKVTTTNPDTKTSESLLEKSDTTIGGQVPVLERKPFKRAGIAIKTSPFFRKSGHRMQLSKCVWRIIAFFYTKAL